MKKIVLSSSELRNNIFKIVAKIQKKGTYCLITRYNKPEAVMISFYDFNRWRKILNF